MMSVAVSLSTMAYYWAMGATGAFEVAHTEVYDQKKEIITIEHIWFYEDGTAKIVVRNVGVLDAEIGAIYVDGVLGFSSSSSRGVVIPVGNSESFLVSGISSTWHLFKVATLRGNVVSQWQGPLDVMTVATQAMTGTQTTTAFTTVTTIVFQTTYTTTTTSTTTYPTRTSTLTTTSKTTYVSTWTYICECTTKTYTTTKTSTIRSTGTTTMSTTRTTTITTTVTTYITTTSTVP